MSTEKAYEKDEELHAGLEITPNDVKIALEEQGIEPTQDALERVCLYLEGIARDWAKATLQDEKDWKTWLEEEE